MVKIAHTDVNVIDAYRRNWIYVHLKTDNGFIGVGEAIVVFSDAVLIRMLGNLRSSVSTPIFTGSSISGG